MKRVIWGPFLLILCTLTACSLEKNEKSMETQIEQQVDSEALRFDLTVQNPSEIEAELEIKEPEEVFSVFGPAVLLPENSSWIKNTEYTQFDENNLIICYRDAISEADCTLLAVRNGTLDLQDYDYHESLEETWEGNSPAGETVYVKVQHSADGTRILVTWEYGDYKFAIQGDVDVNVEDTSSIPKTALYIISNFVDK